MEITFLGISGMLDKGFSSNILLDLGISGSLLIDCGYDILESLEANNRSVEKIDNIYISHLHGDHCGGLERVAFYKYFLQDKKKTTLFIHESLVDDLWSMLRPSLQYKSEGVHTMDDYFDIRSIKNDKSFMIGQHNFRLIKNKHVDSDTKSMFSYGLVHDRSMSYEYQNKNESPEIKKIYYSTDTMNILVSKKWPEHIKEDVLSCDLFFHECSFIETPVHAFYDDLKKLSEDIRKKMYLYHYSLISGISVSSVSKYFAGLIKSGEVIRI